MNIQPLAIALLSTAALGGSLVACAPSQDLAPPEARGAAAYDSSPSVTDGDYQTLVADNNQFAADLLQQVAPTTGNLFFSPYSLSAALAMTYAGANGDTATQIAGALDFTLPPAQLHPAMNRLALDLAARAAGAPPNAKLPFELHVDNSLWAENDDPIEQPFLNTLITNYDAGVYQLDFIGNPDGARDTINGWVADQTDQHITDLIPEHAIDDSTRLVLTDAIYFQAGWAQPFDPTLTANAAFTTGSGATVQTPMMSSEQAAGYADGSDYQAVELAYAGNYTSCVFVLPKATDAAGLAAFEAGLSSAELQTILSSLTDDGTGVSVSLPLVSYKATLPAKTALQALGMVVPFSDSADFTAITTLEPLHIQDVLHQGFVDMNEAGTSAGAATAVVIGAGAAAGGHVFVANRPYLVFIRDTATGQILFAGRVSDPTQT